MTHGDSGLSSSYGFASGAWPFGVVEAICCLIALHRFYKKANGGGTWFVTPDGPTSPWRCCEPSAGGSDVLVDVEQILRVVLGFDPC